MDYCIAKARRAVHPGRRVPLVLGLLPLLLAGCGGQPIQPGATVKSVSADHAMVMPAPGGPGIVSIIEKRYDNAIQQEIHLSTNALTPGQNVVTAQFFGTVSPFRYTSNNLSSTPVTTGEISREIAHSLPGLRMARSSFYVQNSYGPFGYAFGRGTGTDLCMFAWQQIRSPAQQISPMNDYGSIQIRARICEAGATEQTLLAFMYNFTISGAVDLLGWNPYGNVKPLSPDIGQTGTPIYPRAQGMDAIVATPPPMQPATAPRRAPAVIRRAAPVTYPPAQQQAPLPANIPHVPGVSSLDTGSVNGASGMPAPTTTYGRNAEATGAPSSDAAMAARVVIPSPSCAIDGTGATAVCR